MHSKLLLAVTIVKCIPALTCLIFFVLATVPFTCSKYFNINSGSINKTIKITILCYFSFDLIASTFLAILSINNNYQNDIIEAVTFIFHGLGHVSFYLVLIVRLYILFKDSVYQYKKSTFIILLISATIIEIYHFCIHTIFEHLSDFSDKLEYIFIASFIAINIIFGLTLIYLFIRNLLSLVINQRQSISLSTLRKTSQIERLETNVINERTINFVNIMTKNCTLCIAAVIFRNIGVIGFTLSHDQKASYFVLECLIVYNISLLCELLCIYMTFKFVSNWYQKICGRMHKIVFKCFEYYAQKKSLQAECSKLEDYHLFTED